MVISTELQIHLVFSSLLLSLVGGKTFPVSSLVIMRNYTGLFRRMV